MTVRTNARLETDRAYARQSMPRTTEEHWNESLGTAVWYYEIENELGVTFEFASFFDGAQYRTAVIRPEGLEVDLTRRNGAHRPHVFADGYVCLGSTGGAPTLAECWAKTAMWAYHVAAYMKTGEWLFLNQ